MLLIHVGKQQKKKKKETQRDITIVDSCVSMTTPTVRPPQMYQGAWKVAKRR